MIHHAGKTRLLALLSQNAPPGARWALRGGTDAVDRWLATDGVKDLDIWVHSDDLDAFCAALAPHVKGVISLESDPRWLRHVVFVMSDNCGGQILDISYGDLTVGGALTCPQELVSVVASSHGPILSSVSVVADLVLRKLMRGKLPRKDQMVEARLAWKNGAPEVLAYWNAALGEKLGARLVARLLRLLDGGKPQRHDSVVFVLGALNASRRRAGLSLMLRRRRRYALWPQARTLFKRPMAPVLIRIEGADSARGAKQLLHALGVRHVLSADALTNTSHVLRAAISGQTVIATHERMSFLPGLTDHFFGGSLPLDPQDEAGSIASYLATAHRWYIDKPEAARKLVLPAAGADNE